MIFALLLAAMIQGAPAALSFSCTKPCGDGYVCLVPCPDKKAAGKRAKPAPEPDDPIGDILRNGPPDDNRPVICDLSPTASVKAHCWREKRPLVAPAGIEL